MSKLTLLEEARALSVAKTQQLCIVRKVQLAHPDLADQIADMIRAHDISSTAIEDVLGRRDIEVKSDTIRRHRQGRCSGCKAAGVTW